MNINALTKAPRDLEPGDRLICNGDQVLEIQDIVKMDRSAFIYFTDGTKVAADMRLMIEVAP